MDDLRQRFATLDRVPVPDVWGDVERRLEALGTKVPTGRVIALKPGWRGPDGVMAPTASAGLLRGRRSVRLVAAAALMAALVVGAALAVGSGLVRLPSVVPPSRAPDATLSSRPAPSPSEVSPRPTSRPIPTPAPNAAFPARAGMFSDIGDSLLASDTVGWISTPSGLYRTTDTGRTWAEVRPQGWTLPVASRFVDSIFVDADTMYAASGGSPATIAATHDGGASWIQSSLDVGAISGGPVFAFQTPLTGFATFFDPNDNNPLHVFGTTDGGVTWTGPATGNVPHMAEGSGKLYGPIAGFLYQSAGKADNKPFDNRFFLSADGGATWTRYTFPIGAHAPRNDMKTIDGLMREDNGRILLAMGAAGDRSSLPEAIYESGDDTATWRLVQVLPDGFSVQLLSPTEWVLFSGAPSEIRTTTDGGAHWHATKPSMSLYYLDPRFATLNTAWTRQDCHKSWGPVALCDGKIDDPVLGVTTDGGVTWTRIGP